jgi:CRISPR-associated protein Cmr3
MRGPFITKYRDGNLTRFFSRPADWFPIKGDEEKIHALSPMPRNGMVTSGKDEAGNYFLPQLLFPPPGFKPGKKEYGEWLTYEDLLSYLNGGKVTPVTNDQLFLRESRVGIQIRGGSRAVEPGMLYEAEFVRPCDDVGLYLEVKGCDGWKQTGMIKIGGESHAARYEQLGDDVKVEWLAPPQPLPRRFKIYFATPAYFNNGWEPSNWTQFFGFELKPVAAALKGYETVGGFDYAGGKDKEKPRDKPSRRYVPAGSVYYFESDKEVNLVKNEFTEAMGQIGFGQVMIVEWK